MSIFIAIYFPMDVFPTERFGGEQQIKMTGMLGRVQGSGG